MESSEDECCRVRQSLEIQALEAIFTSQIRNLKGDFDSEENWIPLSFLVAVGPLNITTVTPERPSIDVQINCGKNYPLELPEIKVVNWNKIPNKDIQILERQIESNYDAWRGKEMIYDLCNSVGEFISYYLEPEYMSFHDEMINRQKALDEMIAQEHAAKKQKEMAEIQERKEIVKKALRRKSHSKDASLEELLEAGVPVSSPEEAEAKTPALETEKDQDWTSLAAGKSRFHSDFELISWLGAGAYGRVAKVRNKVDDRHYAIKEIKLDMSNKSFNKTIVREVKLLSRLNHENVVRYYNSWFETDQDESSSSNDDNEGACLSSKDYNVMEAKILCETRSFYLTSNYNNDDSGDIYFERSQFDEPDESEELTLQQEEPLVEEDEGKSSEKPPLLMYIQMELCDRSTLRNEIDENNLYKDVDRSARLFREIVEGLSHIHQLSIIHRDLKPGNIFISDNDHVKIGDFGLATSVRFKGAQTLSATYLPQSQETGTSHSSNVGTYFYIAPEVGNKAAQKHYNQKVDIFSLGVIFFEMNHPSFTTGMERYKVLTQLTTQDVNIPESFPHGPTSPAYKLVKWMLNHNAKERPSASDLLSSHFLPPPILEDAEVKDVIRQTLENPQSKIYKYMMESCFSQSVPPAVSASFNVATWRSVPFLISLEIVSEKLRGIFHRHGAVSCLPPLLIPAIDPPPKAECLMTRDGSIVYPTRDVQTSFARLLIDNSPITNLKRYAIDKVYEARPVGLHPKEIYQCSFDVVTPRQEDQGAEIELLSVFWEVLNEFPQLINKSCVLYLNHSSIVKAMFNSLGITKAKKIRSFCQALLYAKNECFTKQEFVECIVKLTDLHEHLVLSMYNWTSIEGPLNEVASKVQALIKTDADSEMCTKALNYLEKVINRCELIGINITIKVKLGVIQSTLNQGLIFQMECFTNNKMKSLDGNVLVAGGNYDHLLDDLKAKYPDADEKITQSVCGFVLYVEKLITALECQGKYPLVDIVLFSLGAITWTSPRIKFAIDLWRSGFKVTYVIVQSMEETQACAAFYGASFIIIMKESDQTLARLKSISKEWKHFDKNLCFPELLEYLNTVLKAPGLSWATRPGLETSIVSAKKNVIIVYVEYEFKFRKKLSALINAAMMSFAEKLSNSTKIVVIAAPLSREAVKNVAFELDLCDYNPNLSSFLKRLSKYKKKVITKLVSEFEEHKKDPSAVIVIYSIHDVFYKPLIHVS